MSEFSDRPFVAGSLTGIRSFRVDRLGRLVGPSSGMVFTPGENIAACMKPPSMGGVFHSMYAGLNPYSFYLPPLSWGNASGGQINVKLHTDEPAPAPAPEAIDAPKPEPKEPEQHEIGQVKCSCGYYAYFDLGPNSNHSKGNLIALIQGYGVATVGSRGFRCSKATLQALVIKPNHTDRVYQLVRNNYPDVPVFPSKALALAEFPLTPPDMPTPDTDPDFWTRSAS